MTALETTLLFDKIYGSLLASAVGDALGGPVEGWHYQRIVETYGVVDSLLPYDRPPDYHAHFSTAAGSVTDDTRLNQILCQAIIASRGRPRRGDLVKAIADAYYATNDDLPRGFLEEYLLGGLHGQDKLIWGGQPTNGFIMANSPIGLICPCDPDAAFALSFELDFISEGYARYSAAMAAAAVAAAMQPGATVATIIEAALAAAQAHRIEGPLSSRWHWHAHVFRPNEQLIEAAVEIAARQRDVFSLRAEYYERLQISPLGSEAGQTLAVALGMLTAADGDLPQALIGCVNYGRDNDSYAAVAGAIAGALHGVQAIPADWRHTVEAANPQPDIRGLALALTQIAQERQQRLQAITAAAAPLLRPHINHQQFPINNSPMPHPIICDCDNTFGVPGKPIDDGQTLLYLLGRPDIELLGVTTTFGNSTIDDVHPATERLLREAGRDDIPLQRGAAQRGQTGTAAARFLAETVAARPREISLLVLGPPGNLRAAAQIDPAFFSNLKQIAVMGGYLHPLELPGWEHVGEVNLSGDPEAAYDLLHAACPVTVMNAHICFAAPFGLAELAPIEAYDPRAFRIQRDYLLACEANHLLARDFLWDLLPAIYLSYPYLFDNAATWIKSTVADLETGMLVPGKPGQGALVNMPGRILDVERFYDILYAAWAAAPKLRPV